MTDLLNTDWDPVLSTEFKKTYFKELLSFIKEEYVNQIIYPSEDEIFNALLYTPLKKVKVVLLGQDPYHGPGQAHGLSFSVQPGVKSPPSLVNIFKELESDLGVSKPSNGYLKKWADEGVLLLNTVLTVRANEAHSHKNNGWETFTDAVIRTVNDKTEPVVFLLWGNPAQTKAKLITNPIHLVIKGPHPSPLSVYRGFYGSKPFSTINQFLMQNKIEPIDWDLTSSN